MKKLYAHENRLLLFNLKNLLENEGIEVMVLNEFASGGAGDLGIFETWPEIWVQEAQYQRSKARLEAIISEDTQNLD